MRFAPITHLDHYNYVLVVVSLAEDTAGVGTYTNSSLPVTSRQSSGIGTIVKLSIRSRTCRTSGLALAEGRFGPTAGYGLQNVPSARSCFKNSS
jgi:hypothetical protein